VAVQERQEQCWGFHRDAFGATSPDHHYRGFYENECPVGGTLIGMFAAGGRWVATLQLYRREQNMPFQRTDVAFLRLMAPQIGQSILRTLNYERPRLEGVDTGADSKGILILERGGAIRFMTPFGEALLRRFEQAVNPRDNDLPAAISSIIAGMKSADPLDNSRSLIASTPTGAVRVEGSLAGSDGSIAIILSPQLKPRIPDPPLDWPLTRQEREVAGRIMLGFSNREIAANLFISENTVQTHVRHIFDKLDISRRSQLSARFFREVYLPRLMSDPET
jgi:DNA-binding CsgD family transcriptional regulator